MGEGILLGTHVLMLFHHAWRVCAWHCRELWRRHSQQCWMTVASTWTHRLLYVLMAFVPLAGMAAWFGGIDQFGEIHVLLMNALLIVSGIHAAAALYHHFIMKDGLLKRMWFKH